MEYTLSVFTTMRACINAKFESVSEDKFKYTKKMTNNYVQFFEWYSAELYKAELMYNKLLDLKALVANKKEDDSFGDVLEYLRNESEKIEFELLNRCMTKMSMSPLSNLVSACDMEAKQRLRQFYCELLSMIK